MLLDDDGEPLADSVAVLDEYLLAVAGVENEVESELAVKAAAEISGLKPSAIKRQLRAIRTGKTSDGRALTSAANGEAGGRPRNDYAGFADEYMGARMRDGVFTRRFYRGAWRRYSKGRWVEVTDDDMKADIVGWVRRNYRDLAESRTVSNMEMNLNSADTGHIMSEVDAPVWLLGHGAEGRELEPAPGWMPMGNGLLNIPAALDALACGDGLDVMPDGIFVDASPRLFSLHYLDYDFVPAAGCPQFLGYLEDVQPDPEARAMIQCMMGLMLVPETRFNVFFLLHGQGGTGKSVFLHVLDNLVGRHNVCTVPLPKLDDDHYTWQLTENLMNSIDDMREVNLRDVEGTIKVATDGGFLDIRRLYKDGGRAKVIARTVAACNMLPRVHEKSDAIWDRLRVIPFNVRVRGTGKQNKDLKHEIVAAELPGIFGWALAGLARLMDMHVFPEHPGGLAAKDTHRGECDPTAEFLREFYERKADSKLFSSELYGHYKEWAAEHGYRQQAAGTFARDVERVFGVEKKKMRISGKQCQGFTGLRRNPDTYAQVDDELIEG
jgi:putative DNA primase/helicase